MRIVARSPAMPADPDRAGKGEGLAPFLALAGSLFALWALGRLLHLDTDAIERGLAGLPRIPAGLAFVALYVAVTFVVWFSKDFFRILAAVVFGAAWGTALVWTAEMINACILFPLARKAGRGYVERVLGRKHRRLDETLASLPFAWLLLFRTAPLFPFRFLDLAAGLTGMSFRRYLLVCALGTLPRMFWLESILAAVGKSILTDPYAAAAHLQQDETAFYGTCGYLVLVIAVIARLRRPAPPPPPPGHAGNPGGTGRD